MVTEYQRRMDGALKAADLYSVPLDQVMHRDMLDNWRRRTKRLERAHIRAALDGDHRRATALTLARYRLATGRLHP